MTDKQRAAASAFGRSMVYQRLESVMGKLPERFTTNEAIKHAGIRPTARNKAFTTAVLASTFKFPQSGVFWIKRG